MSKTFNHGYALLIAVDESAAGYALPDVIKDVEALREVLVHPQRCGYTPNNVKVISGTASTREGIGEGLDWLKEQLTADTSGNATAIIYYTGHGHVEGGNYYLIPYDVKLNRLRGTAINAADFAADVAALQPKRLLVMLDCCHAAGLQVKGAETAGPAIQDAAIPPALFMDGEQAVAAAAGAKGFDTLTQGAGRAVLSSSQADQRSWIRKDGRMSIFTYHLIEALTGHAQPPAGASEVLVSDVMSHVWRCVPASARSDWNAEQQPDYQVSGNFPIAQLLGGKGLGADEAAPDPLQLPPTPKPAAQYQASLTGSGAIAQGPGATAVGQGGVSVGGKNTGNINTGTQTSGDRIRGDKVRGNKIRKQIDTGGGAYVAGSVTAGGDFVGRDKITQGFSPRDLEPLFAPLLAAVAQQAPAEQQAVAVQQVQELKAEVARGEQADDGRVARVIDGLTNMVPGAIGAVLSLFTSPILTSIAGNATQFVLDKLKRL